MITRCALKAGHQSLHLWIQSTCTPGLGECWMVPTVESTTSTMSDAIDPDVLRPWMEAAWIADVAEAILTAICRLRGQPVVKLNDASITIAERHRLIRTAAAAVWAHQPSADPSRQIY